MMNSGHIILCLTFTFNYIEPFRQSSDVGDKSSYKAAVYEHPVIFPAKPAESYEEAVEQMMLNLNEYKKQADIAGSQGVDIIVFPEYGISGYKFVKPADIEAYLEYIPDTDDVNWTPCADPNRFNRSKIQTFLSCLANNNSLYLVANYGDAQPCELRDPNCPKNGQYQYNTNVVYDRNGKFIARYHKEHLFFETHFQEPAYPERIVFETEFGRFGTFTCFDILFYEPAIPLVEQFNITDIVFPTAWMDALPYFSAIGYHSSFAAAYNVNLLASNIHNPSFRFQGSGIYTPNGAKAFYYDSSSPDGRLLVQEIPKLDRNVNTFRKINFTFGSEELQYLKSRDFKAQVFNDWYNFVSLRSTKGNVTVCMEEHCCFLSYERDEIIGNYAFGVFNGMHVYEGQYYLQICILLKCASHDNQDCGNVTYTADGYFSFFNIRGNFSTPYVTPQIIASNNGSLELPARQSMQYDTNGLTGNAKDTPLLETALIGRIYNAVQRDAIASTTCLVSSKTTILMQLIFIFSIRVCFYNNEHMP